MTIDIERLGILLDRGADIAAASLQAKRNFDDAVRDELAAHTEIANDEAALRRLDRADEVGRQKLQGRLKANRDALTALSARVARRRAEASVLARRANAWARYCDSLRDLSKKYGVVL